jgi:iron(III) transport system ATP-binding protein
MNAIIIRSLDHRYGRHPCLCGLDLDCAAGAITCLLGASGCGKSTLLRCIAGHERICGGVIRIGDETLADEHHQLPPERRGIGLVFQDHALFPHLRVWQNVAFGLHRLPRRERRRRAEEELARLAVAELAERYPHTCSGGQQQRVALARALAPRPRALLLDEPFSGLDAGLREQLREELLPLLRARGIPTLLVTHDPREALASADHIALLRAGRLVQSGPPQAFLETPADEEVRRFFRIPT